MKLSLRQLLVATAIACLCTFGAVRAAQEAEPAKPPVPATEQAAPADVESPDVESDTIKATDEDDWDTGDEDFRTYRHRRGRHDDVILRVSGDSHLPAGKIADGVISIFGSASSDGDVREAVVSIFGNTRVSGRVGQDAVAVFGSTSVDGRVRQNVLALFGDVELGPKAEVGGDVTSIGGSVTRDPSAVVHGATNEVFLGKGLGNLQGLRTWIEKCLLLGRPLAFEPGLGWAWGIALAMLALYLALALLFPGSVEKCVETIEKQPGQSALASVLAMLLTPVVILLLAISVIGIPVIPFLGLGLFCAGIFGKAVILGALGRRVTVFTGIGAFSHIAFAVLVGGLIVLVMYVVPVLGFITYQLTNILGLGVVVYTLLLLLRARRESIAAARPMRARPDPQSGYTSGAQASTAFGEQPASTTFDSTGGAPGTEGTSPNGPAPFSAAPSSAAAATPEIDATLLPRAPFMIRMAALLIDVVLIGIIVSVLDPPGEVFLLALATYGALMWKLKSTTIGGIVCSLKVVRLDGREIAWDTAIVRALGCFLSIAFVGLGFLWIVFDPGKQSWHDKIAGTIVVRTPKAPSLV